jgi:PAS domain-containing protein
MGWPAAGDVAMVGEGILESRRSGGPAGDDFTIGEVATPIGVSPYTIRAWERRHRAVTPRRTPSRQRRYSADEVEALRRLRRETAARQPGRRAPARGLASPGAALGVGADGWRTVADLLPDLILVLEDGAVLETNVAVARLTGGLRERLRGRRLPDLVEPFDRAHAVIACLSPLRRRRGWELSLRTARGGARCRFDCRPVRDGGRELLMLVGRPG